MSNKIKHLSLLVCCCFWLLLPGAGWCTGTTTDKQPATITMSVVQYNQLKTTIRELESNLSTLQMKLNKLDGNSTTLQTQLTAANEQLTKTKNSLQTASVSLTQANNELQRQKESLQTLTDQINNMTKKEARLKRQRDTWAVTAGILLVGWVTK